MSQPSNARSLIPRRIASLAKKGKEIPTAADATGSGRAGSSKGVGCRCRPAGAFFFLPARILLQARGATTVRRRYTMLFVYSPVLRAHASRAEGSRSKRRIERGVTSVQTTQPSCALGVLRLHGQPFDPRTIMTSDDRLREWSRLQLKSLGTARLLIDLDYTSIINSKSCLATTIVFYFRAPFVFFIIRLF